LASALFFTEGKYADLLWVNIWGIASCIILYCVPKWIKKIEKIGQLTGKVLVFGGVYSNFKHSSYCSGCPKEGVNPTIAFLLAIL
jgi:hypothetical protein